MHAASGRMPSHSARRSTSTRPGERARIRLRLQQARDVLRSGFTAAGLSIIDEILAALASRPPRGAQQSTRLVVRAGSEHCPECTQLEHELSEARDAQRRFRMELLTALGINAPEAVVRWSPEQICEVVRGLRG